MKEQGIWLEITTLLIPGFNDSSEELKDIASFIVGLGPETPWHVSRFHPQFQMLQTPSTPVLALNRACRIGKEAGLQYVYSGNVPGDQAENTICANCGQPLIERHGYKIIGNHLLENACANCGRKLEGIL